MKDRKRLIWMGVSAILFLAVPWLTAAFIRSDAGMAVCFLLFYAVNPIYAVVSGIFAGRDIRRRWLIPILTAAMFLLGVWIAFEAGEPVFLLYAGIYLALAGAAMLLSSLFCAGRNGKSQEKTI